MKLITLLFLLPLIVGCTASTTGNPSPATLETLYGYRWQGNILFVDVVSHGCTKTQDFSLGWPDPDRLVIKRVQPDRCRKAAKITTLNFETDRRSGQLIQIINPVQATRIKSFAH